MLFLSTENECESYLVLHPGKNHSSSLVAGSLAPSSPATNEQLKKKSY